MRTEAEARNMVPRHSMLNPRDSFTHLLPMLPDPYAVQPVEEPVQVEQQPPVAVRATFAAQEPDLETVAEASQESDDSSASGWETCTSPPGSLA
jgi:hypothetical protein